MKKPVDMYVGRFINLPVTKSGAIAERIVDQLPIKAEFKSANGFYRSDISLLLDLSEKNNKVQFDALASRLQEQPVGENAGKSVVELFDLWKPQYIQTASELQEWPRYLQQTNPELYARLYPDGVDNTSTSEYREIVENDEDS